MITNRPHLRFLRRRAAFSTFAFAIAAAIAINLLTPAAAHAAGTYVWKNVDGDWNNAANWEFVPGSGSNNGYPRFPGDQASFINAYSAPRTVTIPNAVVINIGALVLSGNQPITIRGGGTVAQLHFRNPDGDMTPANLITLGGNTTHQMTVRVFLARQLDLSVGGSGVVRFSRIGQLNGTFGIVKRGTGNVALDGPNDYTGPTHVNDGSLTLNSATGLSIRGELTVGDGSGSANSAFAQIVQPDQVDDAVSILVRADGRLHVPASDRVGKLNILGGIVNAVGSGTDLIAATGIAMTGGQLHTNGDARLLMDSGEIEATSSTAGPAIIARPTGTGTLDIGVSSRTLRVADGPNAVDLEISAPIVGTGSAGLLKEGAGVLRFTGDAHNKYPGDTLVRLGRVELARGSSVTAIPAALTVGSGQGPAVLALLGDGVSNRHNIHNKSNVTVNADGLLLGDSDNVIQSLTINDGGRVVIGSTERAGWLTRALSLTGGELTLGPKGSATVFGNLTATSTATKVAAILGTRALAFNEAASTITVNDGPQAIDLRVDASIYSDTSDLRKRGAGVATFRGTLQLAPKGITLEEGTLLIDGETSSAPTKCAAGTLGGRGVLNALSASGCTIAPGNSPGRLSTDALTLSSTTTFAVELNGSTPGTDYDQVLVKGTVTLAGATLRVTVGPSAQPGRPFTIIENDAADAVVGTFAGLAEGAAVMAGGRQFEISYRGGDGNDVALHEPGPISYYLAEGATGEFFDDDVLIANPNDTEAPVTLTFLQEGGNTIVQQRTLAPQSRLTVHVDAIPGLESASASVQIVSTAGVPLVVERSMFWDQSYYGGHTAQAVARPETRWIFAEGFQGFFDTYVLIANANAEPTTVTLTFLREGDSAVVKTEQVGPFARRTLYAGDYEEVRGRAFGIIVEATRPVIAERAMYFASQPGKLWSGGHVNTGITAPATSWFHAEGATGSYFSTFILLSNPQTTPAQVQLRFLLDTGEVITRQKTLAANQRLTINPAAENDSRLENAAVSTIVESDVPIVSERSMYWLGDAAPFGEGHNSSGAVSPALRWGLAEGRIGGPHAFDTYILLANPSAQDAHVTVSYLRESGAPVSKTYIVRKTSRFNIDVKTDVPELQGSAFGARIEVTNDVPIVVERSLYWNANGSFWAGGSNALATPIP